MIEKIESHRRFWEGKGPPLLLVPTEFGPLYDPTGYDRRFADPELMWEAEVRRARAVVDWPTDGIPTVRANLGVVFVPSVAGQGYHVHTDQMPWPGEPLAEDAIRAARCVDLGTAELVLRAPAFYRLHRERGERMIAPYHPDTQGVFDVAHLLYGDKIFSAMAGDDAEQGWVVELLEICLDLYLRVTRRIKEMLGEPAHSMIHGHGTAQGVFFPQGGVRISEDTATLRSPAMIDCCADSGTVLYSRLPALEGEHAVAHARRVGMLLRETGTRVILRATVPPRNRDEAMEMLETWRLLTQCSHKP